MCARGWLEDEGAVLRWWLKVCGCEGVGDEAESGSRKGEIEGEEMFPCSVA